jgi:CheY-like chemotaxis protein
VYEERRCSVLLVCAAKRTDIQEQLKTATCDVIAVNDGETALARVRRERFDLAVLGSTGETMDLIETVFNLKDIRRSMQIVVLTDDTGEQKNLRPIPGVQYCAAPDLRSVVESVRGGVH